MEDAGPTLDNAITGRAVRVAYSASGVGVLSESRRQDPAYAGKPQPARLEGRCVCQV